KQLQKIIADAFTLPLVNVRIVSPFVGGAFGSKGFQWSHILLCAAAAREAKRSVKFTFTRPQMFDSAGSRARTIQKFSVGTDKSGKLLALRHATLTHSSPLAEYTEPCGNMSRMLYSCPNIDVSHRLLQLNLTTPCPMRAPGEAPGVGARSLGQKWIHYDQQRDPRDWYRNLYDDVANCGEFTRRSARENSISARRFQFPGSAGERRVVADRERWAGGDWRLPRVEKET